MNVMDPTAGVAEEAFAEEMIETYSEAEPTLPVMRAELEEAEVVAPQVTPVFPIRRLLYGRYEHRSSYLWIDLRVDIDGPRPTMRLSADLFSVSGATVTYYGSFIVNAPTVTVTATHKIAEGLGTFTWAAGAPRVRVTIPQTYITSPPAPAHLQFKMLDGTNGAAYVCNYASSYFRTVDLEQDYENGVTPFSSYNTGALPSGGPARVLSVIGAYAEAGIQMRTAGSTRRMAYQPTHTLISACQASPVNESERGRSS